MKFQIKRAYEPAKSSDGYRVLVDRLWPRGLSKERLQANLWLKDIAPSSRLRQWFGHDPARFAEFREKYLEELCGNPAVAEIESLKKPLVTLVYGARDEKNNHAVVLQQFLESRK